MGIDKKSSVFGRAAVRTRYWLHGDDDEKSKLPEFLQPVCFRFVKIYSDKIIYTRLQENAVPQFSTNVGALRKRFNPTVYMTS